MEGTAGDEELMQLDEIVCSNPTAAIYLARTVETSQLLGDWATGRRSASRTASARPLRSAVLDFLHTALRNGRQVVARHYVAAALVLLATIVPLFVWLASTPSHQNVAVSKEQGIKTPAAAPSPNSVSPAPELAAIARLTRAVDIHWGSGVEPLNVGRELAAGQKLQIESGLAEVVFPKGVNLVLQGPVTLTIESRLRVYLAQGRVTARLTSLEAHGFSVRTSRSAVVDEGTEFGVDVAPGGDQNVHVFQGKVQFSATSGAGTRPSRSGVRPTISVELRPTET